MVSDFDKSDAVSDGEELKNNLDAIASEVEFNIFTETEDEIKQKSKSIPTESFKKSVVRASAKSDLCASSPYYNVRNTFFNKTVWIHLNYFQGHSIEAETVICNIKLPLDSKKLLMAK